MEKDYHAVIMTDGSCGSPDELGAWACVVCDDVEAYLLHGTEYPSTNNRCEMLPIIRGIQWSHEALVKPTNMYSDDNPYRVLVLTDSEHVQRSYTEFHGVKANPDLWAALRHRPYGMDITMQHVPRNSTHGNSMCDAFAGALRQATVATIAGYVKAATSAAPSKRAHKSIKNVIPASVLKQAQQMLKQGSMLQ